MTFNVSKISLGGKACNSDTYLVQPLTLNIVSPVCPFNCVIDYDLPTYLDKNNVEHPGTPSAIIWDLLSSVGTSITSFTQTSDFGSFKIPEKFLEPESSYKVRAYVVIDDIGESDWSSEKNIATKVVTLNHEDAITLTNITETVSNSNAFSVTSIQVANTTPPSIVQISVTPMDEIRLQIATIDETNTATSRYNQAINDTENEVMGGIYCNASLDFIIDKAEPYVCCGDGGNNIYIGMAVSSIEVVNVESGQLGSTFIRHVLYKFDLTTNQLIELTDSIETPLLNKEGYSMCVHGNYLYLIGGYQVDAAGQWVSPLEEERTFRKYDLTTFTMTDVEVIGYKPRDYRAARLIVSDEGILKFGGRGKVVDQYATDNAPEMWFYEFASKTWKAFPMFTFPDYLHWDIAGNMVFGEDSSGLSYNLIMTDKQDSYMNWFKYHKEEKFWEYCGAFPYDTDQNQENRSLGILGQYVYQPAVSGSSH